MAGMTPEDVWELVAAGDPRVSPSGDAIAFTVTGMDREENQYSSQIWVTSATTADPRPFTSGEFREMKPRWSPDGGTLAFVSHKRGGEKGSQLRVIASAGGESRRIAQFDEEIDELAWSPEGKRIAFVVRVREEERYRKEKERDQQPRRIKRLIYRLDSVGWTIDRPGQIFVVEVDPPGEPKQITFAEAGVAGLAWSPDGREIATSSGIHDAWDVDMARDLFVIPAAGGEAVRITRTGPAYSLPSWSPDGRLIAFGLRPNPLSYPEHGRIGVIDQATSQVRILSEVLDRNAISFPPTREPVWRGADLYFTVEDSGNTHLYRTSTQQENGKPELVVGGDRQVLAYDLSGGGTTAFVATGPAELPELFALGGPSLRDRLEERLGDVVESIRKATTTFVTSPGGETVAESAIAPTGERGLTRLGASFREGRSLVEPQRFLATSDDGTEVEAWIMPPAEFTKGRRYPTLLNVHGGPFTQYGNRFFDEFQVYAGAGYAVVYSNPRGSSGYPESWGRAIRGPKNPVDPGSGWGALDYEDLMAVVDEAGRRFDFIDPGRLGVLGGSYGGFMTSWIVGHTQRFKAACSERACNNLLTMSWTSDIGHYFFKGYTGASHLDDPEEYLRQSPISYVEDIRTPLLILHSENDLRCPIEQAEQMFVALKLLGREVEFVRFPAESHELSRSGAPAHRVERFRIILDFFDRHLGT